MAQTNNLESFKLLEISESESEIPSPPEAPKRRVKFKKKFRPLVKTKMNPPTRNVGPCKFFEVITFLILLATVVILSWFVINLNSRLDGLQKKLTDLESGNQATPEELHTIHSQLKKLDNSSNVFKLNLDKLVTNFSSINKEVQNLTQTSTLLKESIAAAPEIKMIPSHINSLTQSVVTFGSKITTLEATVKELKDKQLEVTNLVKKLSDDNMAFKTSLQELTNTTFDKSELPSRAFLENLSQDLSQANISTENRFRSQTQQIQSINASLMSLGSEVQGYKVLENFVYTNVSLMMKEAITADQVIQLLNQSLFDNSSKSNASWPTALSKAHRMAQLYVNLLHQINPDQDISHLILSSNSTSILQSLIKEIPSSSDNQTTTPEFQIPKT